MSVRTDDWGEIFLHPVNSRDFVSLYDELIDDRESPPIGRNILLNYLKRGNLFTLLVSPTPSMIQRKAKDDPIFARRREGLNFPSSQYLLPSLFIKRDEQTLMLWIHRRAREKRLMSKISSMKEKIIFESNLLN